MLPTLVNRLRFPFRVPPSRRFPLGWLPGLLATIAMGLSGCSPPPEVITYSIPTEPPIELRAPKSRMLVAMIPVDQQVWIYKVTGPDPILREVEPQFRSFVESLSYDDGKPDFSELPEDWRLGGGETQFRFATIDINTPEQQLDLSVSKFPKLEDYDAMVEMNVNRWRGQLNLPPSMQPWAGADKWRSESADGETERLAGAADFDSAVWINLVGDPGNASSPSAMVGLASTRSDRSAARTAEPMEQANNVAEAATEASPASDEESPIQYATPDGWRPGRQSMMRLAAFNVGPEDRSAEMTIIPAGGDLRSNVARWIGQIRGDTPEPPVVDRAMADAETRTVDGRNAKRFLLLSDQDASDDPPEDSATGEAIDATVVDLGDGMSLFVKMTGPSETVRGESGAIGDFLDSLKIRL